MGEGKRCLLLLAIVTFANVYAQYYGGYNSCLINYCPPYLLPYIPNVLQNILSLLTFSDIGILLRNMQTATSFPSFLNNIQAQSPQLFNALGQMNSAYGNTLFPLFSSTLQNPYYQNFAQQLSSGGVQPALTPQQQQSILPQQQSVLPQLQQPILPSPVLPQPASSNLPSLIPSSSAQNAAGGSPQKGGFGLPGINNLLQPIVEETQQVVDSWEDVVTNDQNIESQPGQQGEAKPVQHKQNDPEFDINNLF